MTTRQIIGLPFRALFAALVFCLIILPCLGVCAIAITDEKEWAEEKAEMLATPREIIMGWK